MDESSVNHNRRARRSPVLLAATVELGGAVHDVKLRNLSSDGALVQGAQDLPENAVITFCRKDLRVRYPKHAWPEDPWTARAERRPARRN